MGSRRPGFALILVLLLVAGIFAMTIHSAVVMRSALVETGAIGSQQRDLRVAQSAASLALRGLMTGTSADAPNGDSDSGGASDRPGEASEDRVDLPPIVRQLLAAAGQEIEDQAEREMERSRSSGGVDGAGTSESATGSRTMIREAGLPTQALEFTVDGLRCVVEFGDALGVVNINTVDEDVLREYLLAKGVERPRAERVVDQILDWRDEDSVPRQHGLEREEFGRLGIVPRDSELRSLDELRVLPEVDDELFELIRGDLCLVGDGRVHLGSASEAVLRSAGGLNASQASELIAMREQGVLNPERVRRVVDLRGDAGRRVRLEPSAVVRLRVRVYGDGAEPSVFEGVAVVSRTGVASLGLRAGR